MSGYNPIGMVMNLNTLAIKYDKYLLDKRFKYIYINNKKGKEKNTLIFSCKKHNFMHLCGVDKYELYGTEDKRKNADQFFLDALSGKLNPKKIIVDRNFYKEKISSLNALSEIVGDKGQLCDRRGVYLKLNFIRSIRTSKAVLAIALKEVYENVTKENKSGEKKLEKVTVNVPLSNIFLKMKSNDDCFKSNTTIIHIKLLDDQYREVKDIYSLRNKKKKN